MLNKALVIAKSAHEGQFDKAGIAYINHPLAVAEMVETEIEKIVALLHDVIEDSELTLENLKSEGFSDVIISAVGSITKTPNNDYGSYLEKVKQNKLARTVKIVDLRHNLDLSRLTNVKKKDLERVEKYKKALEYLLAD